MATKKKLLQAAAGTAAASGGAGALNVEDVFSTYLYEGNGSSQAIENDIKLSDAPVDNVYYHSSSTSVTSNKSPVGDFTVSSGGQVSLDSTVTKYASNSYDFDGTDFGYLELNRPALSSSKPFCFETWVYFNNVGTSGNMAMIASQYKSSGNGRMLFGGQDGDIVVRLNGGTVYLSTTTTVTASTWHHVAWSFDGTTHRLFFNGSLEDSSTSLLDLYTGVNTTLGGNPSSLLSGYNLNGNMEDIRITIGDARYTSSFTVPSAALPTDTADGLGEGGLVWVKNRTSSNDNLLYDTERGANNYLSSNTASAEGTITSLSSFNANGFTVSGSGTYINGTAIDYASWTFRKAPKFFDVVTYTGTGSSLTIDHNLGVEPAVIIIKRTNTTGNWIVFTDVVDGTVDYLFLDATDASTDGSTLLSKTSTDFTLLQSFTLGNASGSEYVAYLFAHNDGDGDFGPTADQDIIKCGSYTGNGSGDGPEIDLGFEPQWIMIKRTDTTGGWFIIDTMRGWTDSSGDDPFLRAESSQQEYGNPQTRPLATGFQPTTTASSFNSSGGNYIYIAIRRGPMAVPTDATDVFDASYGTSNGNTPINLGFSTDTMLYKNTSGSDGYISTRLTGAQYMSPNSTAAEATGGDVYWDDMDGIAFNNASSFTSWIFYNWKRAPSFCDVVAYTGNGTAGRTVSHNLGVAPEMMWVKARDSVRNWSVYHSGLTGSTPAYRSALRLNTTNAELTNETYWNNYPDADNFYLDVNGGDGNVNGSGINYIAYLFASLDGVSKVGSFTSTGSDVSVDCGFSNGARFVMIKRTDAADNWWFWDTERGITSGADNRLALNTTTAAATGADNIDPYSAGFTITSGILGGAGNNFIFYAVA